MTLEHLERLYWIVCSQNYPPFYRTESGLPLSDFEIPFVTRTGRIIIDGDGSSVLVAPGRLDSLLGSIIPDAEMTLYGFCSDGNDHALKSFDYFSRLKNLPDDMQDFVGMKLANGDAIQEAWVLLVEWYRVDELGKLQLCRTCINEGMNQFNVSPN